MPCGTLSKGIEDEAVKRDGQAQSQSAERFEPEYGKSRERSHYGVRRLDAALDERDALEFPSSDSITADLIHRSGGLRSIRSLTTLNPTKRRRAAALQIGLTRSPHPSGARRLDAALDEAKTIATIQAQAASRARLRDADFPAMRFSKHSVG